MPHASPIQPSFSGGEFSPRIYGRVDSERYKTGLATCLNYLPTTQGPIIRRSATAYKIDAKDASKPPAMIAFKFSQTQNYMLEFGDKYIRFCAPAGQITTSSTHFKVSGTYGNLYFNVASSNFYSMRSSPIPRPDERIFASSVILASSVLEIESPYLYPDVHDLKVSQRADTLYIVHSSYPEYKLQRLGNEVWDLKATYNQDGPYLPFNTLKSSGDGLRFTIGATAVSVAADGSTLFDISVFPKITISGAADNGAGLIRITATSHGYLTGDRVFIEGIFGTVEANNGTSSISSMSWFINKISDNSFDLLGSVFSNVYVGSGLVYPAIFEPLAAPSNFADVGRLLALVRNDGGRSWGKITSVTNMRLARMLVDASKSQMPTGVGTSGIDSTWQLGIWNPINGYPNAIAFHQQRKALAGTPAFPQRIDMSSTADYDNFASSGSSYIVTDDSAISQNLDSDELNTLRWLKSDTNGLLAGSIGSEWTIAPNNQVAALTPTNFNASQTSFFGSHNASAIQAGAATLYIQRAQQRVRELNYFFQINTYRSTDVTELSNHLTVLGLKKLCSQKEPIPIVWALRTDGALLSVVYSRDDVALKVGWAPHLLGGFSDSGGSAPVVKSMDVMPSADGLYDQLWCSVQRFINGTSVVTIEAMSRIFDEATAIEDAFQGDCGATYDVPITISNITVAGSSVVSATAHGLANNDQIKITKVVGLNSSVIDEREVIHNSNLVNYHTFVVGSTSTNAFFLKDFVGNYIDSRSYSAYVSGGEVRKLVSSISGFTWLKNEKVSVLTDGAIHPDVIVNSAGVLALTYPAAKVQVGYAFNSDGKLLRPEAGSGDGSSIGKLRRPVRAAFGLHQVGEFSVGTSFDRLTPFEFLLADGQATDQPVPLFSGIHRESLQSQHDYNGQVCFRQKSMLPGMVQSVTVMLEENDV